MRAAASICPQRVQACGLEINQHMMPRDDSRRQRNRGAGEFVQGRGVRRLNVAGPRAQENILEHASGYTR